MVGFCDGGCQAFGKGFHRLLCSSEESWPSFDGTLLWCQGARHQGLSPEVLVMF